jgi:hypothetical protein
MKKGGLSMLPTPNQLGFKIKMHRLKAGLSRKHLATMQAFLKLDVQAVLLRAKSLGIKPGRKNKNL